MKDTSEAAREHGERMAEFHERNGTDRISTKPHPDREFTPEPYFSWQPCEVCGTHLGGDREDYVAFKMGSSEPMYDVSVCTDCIHFQEYGCLPGEQ